MNGFSSTEVFSPYECDQFAFKVDGDSEYTRDDCVGTIKVSRETKRVTKKCRGVVKKSKTRVTGNGTLEVSLHVKRNLYRKIHAMTNEGMQPGVHAYNNTVAMPEVSVTAHVKDEDDNVMFKAWPRCKIEEVSDMEITNGAEEVAELNMKLSYMPDEYNQGEYEALEDELTGTVLTAENWMTEFSSELARL